MQATPQRYSVTIEGKCAHCKSPIQATYNQSNNDIFPWYHVHSGRTDCERQGPTPVLAARRTLSCWHLVSASPLTDLEASKVSFEATVNDVVVGSLVRIWDQKATRLGRITSVQALEGHTPSLVICQIDLT